MNRPSGARIDVPGGAPLVSTIVPTYNRADDVVIAVTSALSQTYPAQEIIVVDDGSTDDTEARLAREFGPTIRYLRKDNGGVSAARNFGVARAAPGARYLAFLDSDDEWLPSKLEVQVGFLERHRDFAMVLTDIVFIDRQRRASHTVRRRAVIRSDGEVLRYVLRDPSLAPSTALITRAAWDHLDGFDTSLRTAEDLDFHLRMALDHKIGVIERPLTRCMRGHDGLSDLSQTWHDHLGVIERFIERHRDAIATADAKAALYRAYLPNARGLIWDGEYQAAIRTAGKGLTNATGLREVLGIAGLAPLLALNMALRGRRKLLALAGRR